MEPDILEMLDDLKKQATEEKTHHYVGSVCKKATEEIVRLRLKIERAKQALYN